LASDEDFLKGRRRGGISGLLYSARRAITGTRGVVVPAWKAKTGEPPLVTYLEMYGVYLADYIARTAIDFQSDMVSGPGFYTTIDSDDPRALEKKAFVDEWCRKVNLDALLQVTSREVIGFGDSYWQKSSETVAVKVKGGKAIDVFGITLIPIMSMEMPKREADGSFEYYKQTTAYGGGKLEVDTVLHFRWNPVGNTPGGIGILSSVCLALKVGDRTREPLYKAIANLHQDIIEHSETWSAPNQMFVFPGEDDEAVEDWGKKLRNAPRRGARWATNIEGATIIQAESRRPGGWDAGLETLTDAYIIALHTPLPKLISKTGFTEASARAALEVAERMTMSLQRFFKRDVEILFEAVSAIGGYDDVEEYVELSWGPPDAVDPEVVKVLFPSFANVWLQGGIKTSELRSIMRDVLHLGMIEDSQSIELELEEVKVPPQEDGENGEDGNGEDGNGEKSKKKVEEGFLAGSNSRCPWCDRIFSNVSLFSNDWVCPNCGEDLKQKTPREIGLGYDTWEDITKFDIFEAKKPSKPSFRVRISRP